MSDNGGYCGADHLVGLCSGGKLLQLCNCAVEPALTVTCIERPLVLYRPPQICCMRIYMLIHKHLFIEVNKSWRDCYYSTIILFLRIALFRRIMYLAQICCTVRIEHDNWSVEIV